MIWVFTISLLSVGRFVGGVRQLDVLVVQRWQRWLLEGRGVLVRALVVVAGESIWMHAVWRLERVHVVALAHVAWSLTHLARVVHVRWADIHDCIMSLRWPKLPNLWLV